MDYWAKNMNWHWLSYQNKIILSAVFIIQVLLFGCNLAAWSADENSSSNESEVVYGPENLLKALPTPFTTTLAEEKQNSAPDSQPISLTPIAISAKAVNLNRNSLQARFHGPKLFLPSRMSLGESSEFTVKGNPGSYVAVAMSEDNKGAKPIFGHKLRLGADRKLVAVGIIPETGMLSLFVETPIQGDLVDASLYFEGAVWSKSDFSDLQMASMISTTKDSLDENGVIVVGQQEGKKQRAVIFDAPGPISTKPIGGLSSGKP
jgi:hypothetical protein